MATNYNIEIVGIQQEAPRVYSITISTYTDIGYRLDINYGGYQPLGAVTYEGKLYQGIELTVVTDPTADKPNTEQDSFIVPQDDANTIGIYVKCGNQIATINFH
ncbi:hypothetical protein EV195_108119 [Tenacibaculum skagerrakense]|uniref:Uncharacterized protein n=1 Tax=Tenacibaculum skagerrakense TaxID=186571 RepID=A0A4R2NPB1_9FLAO|nr:hypothetical protein [Tenacibaculum skagerrakense]TCP23649.1 hypothetical protein EV195_108119 [Tenacibaculum skagerrakense]